MGKVKINGKIPQKTSLPLNIIPVEKSLFGSIASIKLPDVGKHQEVVTCVCPRSDSGGESLGSLLVVCQTADAPFGL